MNFNEALGLLKKGKKVRRTDWNYPDSTYVKLKVWYEKNWTYLFKSCEWDSKYIESYGFTFADTQSNCWEEVL